MLTEKQKQSDSYRRMISNNESSSKIIHYFTKEQADRRIKELETGPDDYMMESNTVEPVLVTKEELIDRVRKLTRL